MTRSKFSLAKLQPLGNKKPTQWNVVYFIQLYNKLLTKNKENMDIFKGLIATVYVIIWTPQQSTAKPSKQVFFSSFLSDSSIAYNTLTNWFHFGTTDLTLFTLFWIILSIWWHQRLLNIRPDSITKSIMVQQQIRFQRSRNKQLPLRNYWYSLSSFYTVQTIQRGALSKLLTVVERETWHGFGWTYLVKAHNQFSN